MWTIFWGLINRDKQKLLLAVGLYFLSLLVTPETAQLFIIACLIILTRNVWRVVEIYLVVPMLVGWGLFGLLFLFAPELLGPKAVGSAFVFFVLIIQKLSITIYILQILSIFTVLVSTWYNVGFFRSCLYSIKYHWDKLFVFLLFLSPWGLYIYNLLVFPEKKNPGDLSGGVIFLEGSLVVWIGLLVPYIISAWLIAQPKMPAAVKSAGTQDSSAINAAGPAAPEPRQTKDSQAPLAGTISSAFLNLLKRDKVKLGGIFILFVGLVAVFPQLTIGICSIFSGLFLAVLTKRFWVAFITPLIVVIWVAFSKAPGMAFVAYFFPLVRILIYGISCGLLLLAPLAAWIAVVQHQNLFQAYGFALSRHFKKSLLGAVFLGFPLFSLWGMFHLGEGVPPGKLFFITSFSGLWLFILVPYMLAAWLEVEPNMVPRQPKPAPAPQPSPAILAAKDLSRPTVEKKTSKVNVTKIFEILLSRDVARLTSELQAQPELAGAVWPDTGNTLLHVAALNGWKEEALILLRFNLAACRVSNKAGKRPAELAQERGYNELAQYLKQKEVDG